jgi:hypothetical protein
LQREDYCRERLISVSIEDFLGINDLLRREDYCGQGLNSVEVEDFADEWINPKIIAGKD